MISRVLPSRFYHGDPADLAGELIKARESDAEYQAKRLLDRVVAVTEVTPVRDDSRRFLCRELKQRRIQALMAELKKGKS